jgi:hypothetical protein
MKHSPIKRLPIKRAPIKGLPAEPLPIEHAPVTGELQLTTASQKFRSKAPRTTSQAAFETTWKATWEHVVGTMTNPDLIGITFLCVIACLIAVNLILRFPNAGLTMEQFNHF